MTYLKHVAAEVCLCAYELGFYLIACITHKEKFEAAVFDLYYYGRVVGVGSADSVVHYGESHSCVAEYGACRRVNGSESLVLYRCLKILELGACFGLGREPYLFNNKVAKHGGESAVVVVVGVSVDHKLNVVYTHILKVGRNGRAEFISACVDKNITVTYLDEYGVALTNVDIVNVEDLR